LAESLINWTYQYVKGHQDSTIPFPSFSQLCTGQHYSRLLASHKLCKAGAFDIAATPQVWIPEVNGQQIGSALLTQLKDKIYHPHMEQRWCKLMGFFVVYKDGANSQAFL
jgi:hypothetical protein